MIDNLTTRLSKLIPVAQLAESYVLFVHECELNSPHALCLQANLPSQRFDEVMQIHQYLKFNPFEPVDYRNENFRFKYHETIFELFSKAELERGINAIEMALDNRNRLQSAPLGE